MAVTTPISYAKNVAKSLGYISVKTIGGIDSDLTDYAKDAADNLKSMYDSLKEFKNGSKGSLKDSSYAGTAASFMKNALSDLSTGKFYNSDRAEEASDKYFSEMSGLDFDFDFDEDDWDSFDNDLANEDNVSKSDVKKASEAIAVTGTRAAYGSSTRIIKGAHYDTSALIKNNNRMFGKINTSIAALTGSVLNLHKSLAEPLDAHIKNSSTFYEFATNEMSKQTQLLTSINTILSNRYGADGTGRSKNAANKTRSKSAWQKVTAYGMPNIAEFFGQAKRNAFDAIPGGGMLGMLRDMLNPEMLEMLKSGEEFNSPVAFLLSTALSGAISESKWGRSIHRIPEKMKNAFALKTGRWNTQSRKGSGLGAILASIFDMSPKANNKFDLSQYNKGVMDWNGMDDKALREVIPTQLSAILAALTGEEAKLFNYKTGKWETGKNALAAFKAGKRAAIEGATYSFKDQALSSFRNKFKVDRNSIAERQFDNEMSKLLKIFAENNINPTESPAEIKKALIKARVLAKKGTRANDYQVHEEAFDQLMQLLGADKSNFLRGSFASAAYGARTANNEFMANFGANGESAVNVLNGSGITKVGNRSNKPVRIAEGFVGNNILTTKDDLGNNLFFYLQDYYKQFRMLTNSAITGNAKTRSQARLKIRRESGKNLPVNRMTAREALKVEDNFANVQYRDSGQVERPTSRGYIDITDPQNYGYKTVRKRKTTSRGDRNAIEQRRFEDEEREEKLEQERAGEHTFIDSITDTLVMLFTGEESLTDTLKRQLRADGGIAGVIRMLPDKIEAFKNDIKHKAVEKWQDFKNSEWGQRFFNEAGGDVKTFFKNTFAHGYHEAKQGVRSLKDNWNGVGTTQGVDLNNTSGTGSGLRGWGHSVYNFTGGASNKKRRFSAQDVMNNPNDYEINKVGNGYVEITGPDGKKVRSRDKKLVEWATKRTESFGDKAKRVVNAFKQTEMGQDVSSLYQRAKESVDRNFGTQISKGKNYFKLVADAVKPYLPETAAGGALGALAGGALTGSGIGLLGGFVIGSGVSLLRHSSEANEALFGKADENGNYGGGILPTKVANFFKKRFPKMAKSGAVGSVLGGLGILPGGIMGGLVLGSGFELLKSTDAFNTVMFGAEGVDGKRRGGLVGAIKVNLIDPLVEFGKDKIGKGGEKISKFFKEHITDPLMSFFNPLKDWAKGFGKRLADSAKDKLSALRNRININPLTRAVANVGGKVGRAALWGAKKAIDLPMGAVRTAGNALELHNISQGYSSKSVQERIEFEKQHPGVIGKLTGRDRNISAYNQWAFNKDENGNYQGRSDQELAELAFFGTGHKSAQRTINNKRRDLEDVISGSLANGGYDVVETDITNAWGKKKKMSRMKYIESMVQSGQTDKLKSYLSGLDDSIIDPTVKEALLKHVNEQTGEIDKYSAMAKDSDSWNAATAEYMKRAGLSQEQFKEMTSGKAIRQLELDASQRGINSAATVQQAVKEVAEGKRNWEELTPNEIAGKDFEIQKQQLSEQTSMKDILSNILKKLNGEPINTETVTTESNGTPANTRVDEEAPINPLQIAVDNAVGKNTVTKSTVQDASKSKNKTESKMTDDGSMIQTTTNAQGESILDINDAGTAKYIHDKEEDRELRNNYYQSMTGEGGFISKLSSLFGFGDKNKDDEGNGLFSKLGSILSGALGSVGTLLSALLPSVGSTILSGLPTVLGGLGIGLAGNALANKFAGSDYDPNNRKDYNDEVIKEQTKNQGFVKKAMTGIDAAVNKATGKNMNTYSSSDFVSKTATQRFTGTMAKNAATAAYNGAAAVKVANATLGRIPFVGKALSNTLNIGKHAQDAAKTISKNGSKFAKWASAESKTSLAQKAAGKVYSAATSVGAKIAEKITPVLNKVFGLFGTNVDDVAKIASEAGEQIAKKAGGVGGLLKTAGKVLYIANIVYAVTDGIQAAKAKTILGIIDEPTIGQRMLSGILNGCNAAIPGIGGLIPTETFFNIFYTIFSHIPILKNLFGGENFAAQRKAAKETLAAYNKENGTTYNIEEYIHNVQNQYTVGQRVGKTVGGFFTSIGDVVTGRKRKSNTTEEATADTVSEATGTGSGIYNFTGGASGLASYASNAFKVADKVTDYIPQTAIVKYGAKKLGNKLGISDIASAKQFAMNGISNAFNTVNKVTDYIPQTALLKAIAKKTGITDPETLMQLAMQVKDKGMSILDRVTNYIPQTAALKYVANKTGIADRITGFAGNIKDRIFGGASGITSPINNTASSVLSGINSIIQSEKEVDLQALVKRLWSFAQSSKTMSQYDATVKDFMTQSGAASEDSASSSNLQIMIASSLMRYIVSFTKPFAAVAEQLNKLSTNGTDDTGDAAVSESGEKSSGFIDKLLRFGKKLWGSLTGGSSGVSDHVMQLGSEKYGNSTLGENGCGPAVAATILRQYGKSANLNGAANFAKANGYVAGASGTKAGYFGDIFNRNGIKSSYTASQGTMNAAISSGRPTVLLGQDAGNTSKANSPFGPHPHYVVARGAGNNVLVDDPELSKPALYPKSILKSSKLGIMTGGDSGIANSYDEAIWGYYKDLGLSDEAVAGILGNIKHEAGSDYNPKKLERKFIRFLQGTGGKKWDNAKNIYSSVGVDVSSDTNADQTYTQAVDSGKISKDEFMHPYSITGNAEYKSSKADRWPQFGYGLTQFTSPGLKESLYKNTVAQGKSIADLGGQLAALTEQLQANGKVWPVVNKSGATPEEVAKAMLLYYESPDGAAGKVGERSSTAREVYNKYKGKTFNYKSFTDTPGKTVSATTAATTVATFPKYNLSDAQLKGVANILQNEQPNTIGRFAEASLMANLVDMSGDNKATSSNLEAYLSKPVGQNWFAKGAERYSAGKGGTVKIDDNALLAAKTIFNEGKRTMPRYIDEHDCFSDIVSLNGNTDSSYIKTRSNYKAGDDIKNSHGSAWKFYSFPSEGSDPFGYTSDSNKEKYGESHFDVDASGNVTGGTSADGSTVSTDGTTSSSSGSSSSSSDGGFDILTTLGNIFGKAILKASPKLGKLLGIDTSESSSSGSSTSSDGSSTTISSSGGVSTTIAGDATQSLDGVAKPYPTGDGTARSVVKIAQSQLGVTEGRSDSGNNDNITDYGKLTGTNGDAWCASFVSWCMDKAFNGDKEKRNAALRGGISAGVSDLWNNFKNAGAMTKDPQPGDVIIFKSNGASHTGLVETVSKTNGSTHLTSIEGNTGSGNEYERNGGVVARHEWTIGDGSTLDARCTGFGRPNWPTSSAATINAAGTGSGLNLYNFAGGASNVASEGKSKRFPTGTGTPSSLINIAKSQIGVLEGGICKDKKDSSYGKPNSGNITDYGKFMDMDAQPWCASFVSWCMDKAFNGDKTKRNIALRGKPSVAVSDLWDNFKRAGAMYDKPEPGDIIIYKNNTSHTGIVESVNGNKVTSVEGNTSGDNSFDRNGGCVNRHQFDLANPNDPITQKLTGFGRPDWDLAYSGTGSGLKVKDFTKGYANNYTGGASTITTTATAPVSTAPKVEDTTNYNADMMKKLDDVLTYLKTITLNSAYAASIPQIITVIQQYGNLLSQVSNSNSDMSADAKAKIENEISSMMSKINGLATAI